ncbi:glycosyltransferase [Parablautia intestinalis]|uniref:Glycosyltransferase n=1 Tax=Parablautia intestinalis TaxID=2320100 RepID=A0A3A9AMZ6_9FIRM|nr:glycosyltransferase family 4 protein [Parablautia intestinalis]RKI88666.1 glycosyltransferase [Parablautia intestinalis]
MKKINVLYILHETFPAGATYSLLDMVDSLAKVVKPVFITAGGGKVERILAAREWKFYRVLRVKEWGEIGCATNLEMQESYVDNYEAAVFITNIIRLEKIDLVHSNTSVNNSGAISAIMSQIPHVYHIREFMEEDFGWEYWNKEIKRQIFRGTDLFISISKIMEKRFYEKYGFHTNVFYDGMKLQGMANAYNELENRQGQEKVVFIQVGVLTEGKGIWDTLKSAKILKEKGVMNFKVQFIGKANADIKKIVDLFVTENGLDDSIEIINHCNDVQKYRYNAEFALVPSRYEGLGRVTIEAMAYGNIVIGANTGGTLELIGENSERGYLFEQGNAESLASVMIRAITERTDVGKRKRKLAFEFAKKEFDLPEYGKKIYKKYIEILQYSSDEELKLKKRDLLKFLDEKYLQYKFELNSNIQDLGQENISLWEKWNLLGNYDMESYLIENEIYNVAIYGAGKYGKRLINYLLDSKVTIKYIIDQKVTSLEKVDKTFLTPAEFYCNIKYLPHVDKIIVALSREQDVNEIRNRMAESNVTNIIVLPNIINELL